MKQRITGKKIRQFFWDVKELPCENKASYLLGDLVNYGVSRCKKIIHGWEGVNYEFDVYRHKDFSVCLVVELSIDFTMKEVEHNIFGLFDYGGIIASDDVKTFRKWEKHILPQYSYDHARYSALRFLEALRKKFLLMNKKK